MKQSKLLALLLSFSMLFTMFPTVSADNTTKAEEATMIDTQTAEIVQVSSNSWQPKATKTVSSASSFPLTLNNGDVLLINGPIDYTAQTGKSPITVASGANAKIIINGSVTLHGANASGITGATAAINVPENATLTIYSAHDQELSASKSAPKDTLTVTGGNAAAGTAGGNALRDQQMPSATIYINWYTGGGGNGGGGAAAAIGGNGGEGGYGAAKQTSPVKVTLNQFGNRITGQDNNSGGPGLDGKSGSQGQGAGTIYVSGRLNLNATGGSAAKGGNGGSGCGGYANTSGYDDMIGGCGGGGGGGGGLSAQAFGAGGAGGSGGGSGGLLSSDHHGNVQGCGGGGGAGGWPNGGGGGGGGAECSDAYDNRDNTSKGGAGGAGGAAGKAGNSGSEGTQTGTEGHGKDDAKPGKGGSGGAGVGIFSTTPLGGTGGEEKDHQYNGGAGGNGGASVALKAWHNKSNLILSTAANINTYSWGDGGGQGRAYALTPRVVYDLMDCTVNLNSNSIVYTGKAIKPTIRSIVYNVGSDRDGKRIANSDQTLPSGNYSIYAYGENIHCPTGTMTVMGLQNTNRTTVTTDKAVVGIVQKEFTIKKATLTAPVSLSTTTPFVNQIFSATLNTYTSATAGSGSLKNLLRASSQKTEGPKVTWSLGNTNVGQCTESNGLNAKFTLKSAATTTVIASLSDMNDFENCQVSIQLSSKQLQSFTATLSTDTPHPRKAVSVNLPSKITKVSYQWYVNGTAVNGATGATYIPSADDIGKKISVKITPDASTGYTQATATAKNAVESHKYSSNGFCTVCDEYEPASLSKNTYQIGNGGQMFWFAALVNGDKTHAEFSAKNQSAAAVLTKDIDLENREWNPIASFSGSFDGQAHTVSKLQITKTVSYIGFFGSTTGTIRNFTLEGEIVLSGKNASDIGGAVGNANSATISDITSAVTIYNKDSEYSHVGGVVGGIGNGETAVEKCMFTGSITISNSVDCIGGIVGYSNGGARISYCANLGTVTTTSEDAYTGGILGYVNNSNPSIKNCYSYGKVQNGGGNYCGAIVGWLRRHNAAKITDNYYLDTSSASDFGSGSNATTAKAVAKDTEAFSSGEVCYFINGSSSADDVIWRQDVDNGAIPYDIYPVFDGGIVLQNREHHDCTTDKYSYAYSNTEKAEDHINHSYVNGFCSCCDAREAAKEVNGVYQITNGGQFYWFAEQINSGKISQNSKALLTANIDLEGSKDGQAAGYEKIVKSRNFPGIGTQERPYTGSFAGGGYTVSDLYINRENNTTTVLEGVGLFGYTNGAEISGLTVKGKVLVYAKNYRVIQRVGGIVGSSNETKLSELFSYVDIVGSGEEIIHVGGVAGDAIGGGSIFKCMYFGSMDLANTGDCVGGITGYTNTAVIEYCANHGSVKTANTDGYAGGIIGYINNKSGIVRNCYNYGMVQNGGGNYCGAIVGWMRSHLASNFTDNYYLDNSAPSGFGSGSSSTSAVAPAKDAAAFASGEVCYLVNSKTGTGDKAVWKQDIDNGNTPYDIYPLFDAAAVYFRSDGTYSNDPEKISVIISWGAMEFEYHADSWNPESHEYNGSWSPTTANGNTVSVQNNSNVALGAAFTFTTAADFVQYNLIGTFNGAAEGVNRMQIGTVLSAKLNLMSSSPDSLKNNGKTKVGDITISLTTVGGGGN